MYLLFFDFLMYFFVFSIFLFFYFLMKIVTDDL